MTKPQDGIGVEEPVTKVHRKTAALLAKGWPPTPYTNNTTFNDSPNTAIENPVETMEKLRRHYSHKWIWLLNWARGSKHRRQVLRLIVEHNTGITYATLENETTASHRSVRRYCSQLNEKGFITIIKKNPRVIEPCSTDSYLLLADAASWPL